MAKIIPKANVADSLPPGADPIKTSKPKGKKAVAAAPAGAVRKSQRGKASKPAVDPKIATEQAIAGSKQERTKVNRVSRQAMLENRTALLQSRMATESGDAENEE